MENNASREDEETPLLPPIKQSNIQTGTNIRESLLETASSDFGALEPLASYTSGWDRRQSSGSHGLVPDVPYSNEDEDEVPDSESRNGDFLIDISWFRFWAMFGSILVGLFVRSTSFHACILVSILGIWILI
jgi:hypothetical protein